MIWESWPWKNELLKSALYLETRMTNQKRWPESSLVKLEKTIMTGFYSIRKLKEANKLSTSTPDYHLTLHSYECKKTFANCMNWHRLTEFYNLDSAKTETRNLSFICDQIIHSFVFSPLFDEDNRLFAVYFTSDRGRKKRLLEISIAQVIEVFNLVGNDYPNHSTSVLDPKNNDYKVTSSMIDGEGHDEIKNLGPTSHLPP